MLLGSYKKKPTLLSATTTHEQTTCTGNIIILTRMYPSKELYIASCPQPARFILKVINIEMNAVCPFPYTPVQDIIVSLHNPKCINTCTSSHPRFMVAVLILKKCAKKLKYMYKLNLPN